MSPKRKHTAACVVDTECTYISNNPRMVYHFGACFGDIEESDQMRNPIKMDYYVKEVIEDLGNFLHQNKDGQNYAYNPNMARVWKDAINNPTKVKSWKHIIEEWQDLITSMGVDYLTSYNFNFDIGQGDKIGTIRKTHQQLTDKTFYLPRNVEYFCLMDIAGTLLLNRDFNRWVKGLDDDQIKQVTTEKGNLSYSAETVARFINKDLWYTEQHTALRDSLLEFGLLCHFWAKWKHIIKSEFVNNVNGVSWKRIADGYTATEKRKLRKGVKAKTRGKKFPIAPELNLQGGK